MLIVLSNAPVRADPPRPGAFFVAPDGNDSWTGHLPAANAAGTNGPFATLGAAQAAMRRQHGHRSVAVRGGSYFLESPLRLDEGDSGESFFAYPGEKPVIYGGRPVRDWVAVGGHYQTSLLAGHSGLPIVLAAGQAVPVARFPSAEKGDADAASWLFAASSPDSIDPHRSFRARPNDAAAFASSPPGTLVTIFGLRGWQNTVLPIKQFDSAHGVVTLDGSTWDSIGEGSRYALLNADPPPGSWRAEADSLTFAASSPPSGIVAATLPCIVAIERATDVTLSGLRFAGSAADGAAICLSQTERVTLDALGIADTGDGIRLDQATGTRITGSEIARTNGSGIVLTHGADGTVASGNWLHDIGLLHQDASAIWFDGSSGSRFVQNRIEDVAKFGIGGGSLDGGGSYDTVIEGNEIDRANQRTSDGGGIMVIGWAQDITRDVIRGNFVSRTGALGNMGWDGKPHETFQDPVTRLVSQAIYLDDWASGVLVTGNLLCGNIGGIELHAGWDNRIVGNFLIGNAGIAFAVDAENWLGRGRHPHAMEHNAIERNSVILGPPSTGQSGAVAVRGPASAASFDHNSYAGPGLNSSSFHQEPHDAGSSYSFGIDAWRLRGQDSASSVGPASVPAALRDGAVHSSGMDAAPPVSLSGIGRPGDRAGLAGRIRQRCGLP